MSNEQMLDWIKRCFSSTASSWSPSDEQWMNQFANFFPGTQPVQHKKATVETTESFCIIRYPVEKDAIKKLSIQHSSSIVWIKDRANETHEEVRLPCLIQKSSSGWSYEHDTLVVRWPKKIDPVLAEMHFNPDIL
ncbi:hypothetical protein G4V62_01765 [Bacillaceae bacterium SIJ1]|uniref:hypothetical protein n=1 Tax=Litoribacterium kuwaitense TaxID=1398745 RepID=UPI0013EA88F1|nr:hypothetical protein [Litoribacterium kuwaitense]NGP43752.1 hypothetical protein [Litoribacterium kuwaitense]